MKNHFVPAMRHYFTPVVEIALKITIISISNGLILTLKNYFCIL
jgi:hypothetical protein